MSRKFVPVQWTSALNAHKTNKKEPSRRSARETRRKERWTGAGGETLGGGAVGDQLQGRSGGWPGAGEGAVGRKTSRDCPQCGEGEVDVAVGVDYPRMLPIGRFQYVYVCRIAVDVDATPRRHSRSGGRNHNAERSERVNPCTTAGIHAGDPALLRVLRKRTREPPDPLRRF